MQQQEWRHNLTPCQAREIGWLAVFLPLLFSCAGPEDLVELDERASDNPSTRPLHWGPPVFESSRVSDGDLHAIFGVAGRVWAVGDDGDVVSWQSEDLPLHEIDWKKSAALTEADLTSIWAAAEDDAWTVSTAGEFFHWDGTSWQQWDDGEAVEGATSVSLSSIWGVASDNIWAVGSEGAIFHFDGQSWEPQFVGVDDYQSIVGTSADNILIAGLEGLLHFDGADWQPVLGASAYYDNVFLGPDESFWVSGFYGYTPHKSSTRSSPLAGRLSDGVYTEILDLKRNAGWPLNDETFVVVNGGRPLEVSDDHFGIFSVDLSKPDDEWTLLDDTSDDFEALWGDKQWVWIVGEGGTVLRYGVQGTPTRN